MSGGNAVCAADPGLFGLVSVITVNDMFSGEICKSFNMNLYTAPSRLIC